MANINAFGNKETPVIGDKLHLWSTLDGTDMNITLEQLRALMVGGDLDDLETDAKTGIVIAINELVERVTWPQNAGFHNSIYRGKYLGTEVTAEQFAQISAGTFKDLYIGDYWTINGVNWRIAAFDYWLNCGDTACTTHHIVIVPDSNLASGGLNSTNITTGAIVGSDYYTGNNSNTLKATAEATINGAFGSAHILTHREYLANAVTNGYQSGGAWYDSTFELMTEQMVYGGKVYGSRSAGSNIPADYTIGQSQLPLFRHDKSRICNRAFWWLRDVVSAAYFASVSNNGHAAYSSASRGYGIRPAFGIKA